VTPKAKASVAGAISALGTQYALGLKRLCENLKRNLRSLHYATPDFL
jgi:aminoglycoside phosphotransferase